MTYKELLKETAEKKKQAIREINKALHGPCGFLVQAEIDRNPGSIAWYWLAHDFCEKLSEHIQEFIDQANSLELTEITDIYMAYEDSGPDLYELLPTEAKLFEE